VLCNIWDVGSARAVALSGAGAVATSSWAVAEARGFDDGEALPFEVLCALTGQIARSVDLPLSVDVEGGYAVEPEAVAQRVLQIAEAGAVGVNVEDRVIGADGGLHPVSLQAGRIATIRATLDAAGLPLFVNARSDVFFQTDAPEAQAALLDEAVARGRAYAQAGADGVFLPGLSDPALIRQLCEAMPVPINVMAQTMAPDTAALAALGVARISLGPLPYLAAMEALTAQANRLVAR
jgi:2-methylisocitrate lyase-like PEP mutase family enzyme